MAAVSRLSDSAAERPPNGGDSARNGDTVHPELQAAATPRYAIVVMGVSGSGKSTLGRCLADRLGCTFFEGDDFHSAASIAKMRAGHSLDDEDRWPWLDRVGDAIGVEARTSARAVVACSALRHRYRDRLAAAAGVPLLFVLMDATPYLLARRLAARTGHFMPASLLDSQLATLERPGSDERALVLDADRTADAACTQAVAWITHTAPSLAR